MSLFLHFLPKRRNKLILLQGVKNQKYRRMKTIQLKKPGNLHYLSIL